jgi:DNA-binding transcriptional LysR family regulator
MSESSPPVDLDLRLVRYFVVVAEQRHFGRAAATLRVAQPSLSRQIHRLEQQLGARLLDRTPRGSRLTEAGEVFLPRAKALLRAAAQAAAQASARGCANRSVPGGIGTVGPPGWRRPDHRAIQQLLIAPATESFQPMMLPIRRRTT